MARCSSKERIFIVEQMTSTNSRKETWRRFKAKFGREVNLLTISATMKKWKAVGSIQNQHKGNSGHKKLARSQENQEKIMSFVVQDNKKSVRRLAFASDMKKSFIHLHARWSSCAHFKNGDGLASNAVSRKVDL